MKGSLSPGWRAAGCPPGWTQVRREDGGTLEIHDKEDFLEEFLLWFPRTVGACLGTHTVSVSLDRSPPGSSVRRIFQTGIQEGPAISSSRGFSQPRDQTRNSCVSYTADGFFAHWATGRAQLDHHWFPLVNLLFTIMFPKRVKKKKMFSVSVKEWFLLYLWLFLKLKKKKKICRLCRSVAVAWSKCGSWALKW